MVERPAVPDEAIAARLGERYGLPIERLEFLPLGADNAAWSYRATGRDGKDYFAKLRRGDVALRGLVVPRYLREHGIDGVIAPCLTVDGALFATLGAYALTLHPFVQGENAHNVGLSADQWRRYGRLLRRVHDTPVDADLRAHLKPETFVPDGREQFPNLQARVAKGAAADDPAAQVVATWRAHQRQIEALLARVDALGAALRASPPPLVLCHADAHTLNLMVDAAGDLILVDWDDAAHAPRERDLMFVLGGIFTGEIGPREEALVREGYGLAAVDPTALAYYRSAWAAQDVAAFAADVLLPGPGGPAARQAAARWFDAQFEPGGMVERALASA